MVRGVGLGFKECGGEAFGRGGQLGIVDGRTVAAHEDGVHDCQGAADAEGKAEEETDQYAPKTVHKTHDVMRRRVSGAEG